MADHLLLLERGRSMVAPSRGPGSIVARGFEGHRRFASDDDDIVDLVAAVSARLHVPARADPPRWLAHAVAQVRDDWRGADRSPA